MERLFGRSKAKKSNPASNPSPVHSHHPTITNEDEGFSVVGNFAPPPAPPASALYPNINSVPSYPVIKVGRLLHFFLSGQSYYVKQIDSNFSLKFQSTVEILAPALLGPVVRVPTLTEFRLPFLQGALEELIWMKFWLESRTFQKESRVLIGLPQNTTLD